MSDEDPTPVADQADEATEEPTSGESPPPVPARVSMRSVMIGAALALGIVLVGLLVYLLTLLGPGLPGGTAQGDVSYGLEPVLQIGGPGTGDLPSFSRPMGIAYGPEGRLYVADTSNNRVVVFSRQGRFLFEFGEFGVAKPLPGGKGSWEPGRFNYPTGIDVDKDGTVYVADFRNDQIQVFDSEGGFLRRFPDPAKPTGKGGSGSDGTGIAVTDVAVKDGKVYATDAFQVFVFTTEGELLTQFGKPGSAPGDLDHPNGIAVADDGTIYVADSNHNRVTAFSPEGAPLWNVGAPIDFAGRGSEEGLGLPRGIAVMSDGTIVVADAFNFEIVLISPQGEILHRLGTRGDQPAELDFPNDVDVLGDEVLIADRGNGRAQVVRIAPE